MIPPSRHRLPFSGYSLAQVRGSLRTLGTRVAMLLTANPTIHIVQVVAAIAGLLALTNWWLALCAPCELEVREGTVWIQVLAQSAAVPLYDHTRVAFINMMHGPLDPVFKYALHVAAPFLPAHLVTRSFVALLPVALVGLGFACTRRLLPAVFLALTAYLFLLSMGAAQFLIGRSDPTALVFLCALLGAGELLRSQDSPTPAQLLRWGPLLGLLGATVVLLNWRFAPVAVGAVGLYGLEAASRTMSPIRSLALFAGTALLGGMALLAAVVLGCFGGDVDLYWRHFFGLFTRASGWGLFGRMPFEVVPFELTNNRMLLHLAFGVAAMAALRSEWTEARNRWVVASWLVVFAAAWLAITWAFARNHAAGGIHYFAPLYLLALTFVGSRFPWRRSHPATIVALALSILLAQPWVTLSRQISDLAKAAHDGRAFLDAVHAHAGDDAIYSEDVYLFQNRYQGEVMDSSDTAVQVASTDFFGPSFRQVLNQNAENLRTNPPAYVLAAGLITPGLRALLQERYQLVLESGPVLVAQFGGKLKLYKRTTPALPVAAATPVLSDVAPGGTPSASSR